MFNTCAIQKFIVWDRYIPEQAKATVLSPKSVNINGQVNAGHCLPVEYVWVNNIAYNTMSIFLPSPPTVLSVIRYGLLTLALLFGLPISRQAETSKKITHGRRNKLQYSSTLFTRPSTHTGLWLNSRVLYTIAICYGLKPDPKVIGTLSKTNIQINMAQRIHTRPTYTYAGNMVAHCMLEHA